jgi:hypothetical protein
LFTISLCNSFSRLAGDLIINGLNGTIFLTSKLIGQKTEGTKESKKADSTRSPDQSLVSPAKGREEKKKPAQSPTSPTATTTPVKQQTQGEGRNFPFLENATFANFQQSSTTSKRQGITLQLRRTSLP